MLNAEQSVYRISSRTNKRHLSREKPLRTLLRSNKFDKELKNIRCPECKKILFQAFSATLTVVPGHPDTNTDPGLLDENTIILECNGMTEATAPDGAIVRTRCHTRYFVT